MFVVDDGKRRLGILTDLGHVFADLADVIASLDAVLLESNYDPEMLENGSYPEFLKKRIVGPADTFPTSKPPNCSNRRLKTHEMGVPGASVARQQHARPGVENASKNLGRPHADSCCDSV